MKIILTALLAVVALASTQHTGPQHPDNLDVVYEWKTLKFNVPHQYSSYINNSRVFLSGVLSLKDRFFLATGPVFGRNQVSLSTVPKSSENRSPVLQPYPSWEWHREVVTGEKIADCNQNLVCVCRTRRDDCGRLWVMDSGVIYDADTDTVEKICPPKIVIFDVDTDKEVRTVTLPSRVLTSSSLVDEIIIDNQRLTGGNYQGCDDYYVYMLDTFDPAVIVYDSKRSLFSRRTNTLMQPEPEWAVHTVAGVKYEEPFGVISSALSGQGRTRRLYMQAYASNDIISSLTLDLQNSVQGNSNNGIVAVRKDFTKPCEAFGLGSNVNDGSVLYSPICKYAIYSWNPVSRTVKRLTARDEEKLQVVEDIKPDDRDANVVYAISSREQLYYTGQVDTRKYNQRLIKVLLDVFFFPVDSN